MRQNTTGRRTNVQKQRRRSSKKMSREKTSIIVAGILTFLLLAIDVHSCDFHDAVVDHCHMNFSYVGLRGPDKWGSLRPDYATCSKGMMQSPIDIRRDNLSWKKELQSLNREYKPANASLNNYGFSVGVKMESEAGVLVIGNKNYSLLQVHWHTPAEHTIDGVRHDAELHLVHKADDGNLSVVSILFKLGDADPFLRQVEKSLMKLGKGACGADQDAHIPLGTMRTKLLKRYTRRYFRYMGSLSVPPCSENVLWNVLGKVREMSKEQLDALKAPLEAEYRHNSRPLQPLNGRIVELYQKISL